MKVYIAGKITGDQGYQANAKESAGARLEKAYCEYIGKEMKFWSD